MCIGTTEKTPSGIFLCSKRSKRSKLQVHRLITRKRCEEEDIELMNLKLYLENKTIVEENEKLRKTVNLLHQENLALFFELQKKFPNLDRQYSTSTFPLFFTNSR